MKYPGPWIAAMTLLAAAGILLAIVYAPAPASSKPGGKPVRVEDLAKPPVELVEKCADSRGGCYVLTSAELAAWAHSARTVERKKIAKEISERCGSETEN